MVEDRVVADGNPETTPHHGPAILSSSVTSFEVPTTRDFFTREIPWSELDVHSLAPRRMFVLVMSRWFWGPGAFTNEVNVRPGETRCLAPVSPPMHSADRARPVPVNRVVNSVARSCETRIIRRTFFSSWTVEQAGPVFWRGLVLGPGCCDVVRSLVRWPCHDRRWWHRRAWVVGPFHQRNRRAGDHAATAAGAPTRSMVVRQGARRDRRRLPTNVETARAPSDSFRRTQIAVLPNFPGSRNRPDPASTARGTVRQQD